MTFSQDNNTNQYSWNNLSYINNVQLIEHLLITGPLFIGAIHICTSEPETRK